MGQASANHDTHRANRQYPKTCRSNRASLKGREWGSHPSFLSAKNAGQCTRSVWVHADRASRYSQRL